MELSLRNEAGALTYSVTVDGQPVLAPCSLGILSDGMELGEGVTLGRAKQHVVTEHYPFSGAHAVAVNHATETIVAAQSHGESFEVDVHVADDGVAIRLRLAAKPGRKVQADRSAWKLPGNPTMWVDAWDPSYESPYRTTTLGQLGTGNLALPITAHVGKLYVTLTEAALKDYGDLAIKPGSDGTLQGQLLNDPQGWETDQAVVQPWRVTVIARNLTALVNTTLVQNLNVAPNKELAGAAWIKPGRSTWQWLASGDPREDEQTQWVDWTKELGFEYYLIDEGWSSGKTHGAADLHDRVRKEAERKDLDLGAQQASKGAGSAQGILPKSSRGGCRGHKDRLSSTHRPLVVHVVLGNGRGRCCLSPNGGFPWCDQAHWDGAYLAQRTHP